MNIVLRLICLLIGYGFGCIQWAYLIGKHKGIDIRNYGSGNSGTTNALRVLGKKAGVIVFIGDFLKAIILCLLIKGIYGHRNPDMAPLLMLYGGFGVVLGHNFPFYLKFKGGKGIACTVGLVFCLSWQVGLVVMVEFFLIFFTTHYVSLGSTLCYVLFLVQTIVFGQMGGFRMSQVHLNELYIVLAALTFMALYRHRANIKRLMSGTESKIYLSKKHKKTV